MKRIVTIAALLSALIAPAALAGVIFQDDFDVANRNTVGNGWSEIERNNNDVAIDNGRLRLRDRQNGIDAAASQLAGISTLGLEDIALSFDWSASYNTESNDSLFVQWRVTGASTWTTLMEQALGGSSMQHRVLALGLAAADRASLQFRFYIDVSASNERVYLDNVTLSGNDRNVAIPEPSTLLLLGIALLAIRRRALRAH